MANLRTLRSTLYNMYMCDHVPFRSPLSDADDTLGYAIAHGVRPGEEFYSFLRTARNLGHTKRDADAERPIKGEDK